MLKELFVSTVEKGKNINAYKEFMPKPKSVSVPKSLTVVKTC